jgi:hypothetical protein
MTEHEKMRFELFNTCLQISHDKFMQNSKNNYNNSFDVDSYEQEQMVKYAYELTIVAYNKFCEKEEL